ncbi:nuclear transport factor 2 family protein [Nocardiopsis alkaliphila]|uniref:nuclear transport factor 2 family protein n=1 Tax=Nocardiopsis alkaliphila TaxID=225762 RepID=UPI001EF9F0E3|nr:nuclear transport factor 2 family protein [Nocardiopsis alkaliphila]
MRIQKEITRLQSLIDLPFGELHARVEGFYARHMQLLDSGRAEEWAAQFTEDAVFDVPTLPKPARGREDLIASVREGRRKLAESGQRHRHWQGVIDVQPRNDRTLWVRAYTQVLASTVGEGPEGGRTWIHRICVCEDVLVVEGETFLVRSRKVTRDDLA